MAFTRHVALEQSKTILLVQKLMLLVTQNQCDAIDNVAIVTVYRVNKTCALPVICHVVALLNFIFNGFHSSTSSKIASSLSTM